MRIAPLDALGEFDPRPLPSGATLALAYNISAGDMFLSTLR